MPLHNTCELKAEPTSTANPSQMPKSEARRHRETGELINGLSAIETTKLSRLRKKAVNRSGLIGTAKFSCWCGDNLHKF